MIPHHTNFRVRYGETDQMGYVYYGRYAEYFEVGRVEWLRHLGVTYRSLEEQGVMLPVTELKVKYLKPAYYDDALVLTTQLAERPGVRIRFLYTLHRENGTLLCEAEVTLVFINRHRNRPQPCPSELLQAIDGATSF
jgi:acyl-CoA thioester hydrolase